MKTIINSILFTAILALALTGCQKETEDINVFLKSAGILTVIDSWQSGNAAFECAEAAGDCGYSYKIDEWSEDYGMNGSYPTPGGNTISIINSNGYTFDWNSEYPVCKVIVKAARGAYVYSYPNGAYSDHGLIGYKGKGISHVTFCYGEPEMPELVVALKSYVQPPDLSLGWTVTGGEGSIGDGLGMGYYNYIFDEENNYKLYYWGNPGVPFGNIIISDYIDTDGIHYLEVVIDNSERPTYLFKNTYLYVGTLAGYQSYLAYDNGIPYHNYLSFPFIYPSETNPVPTRTFKIALSDITE